MKTQLHRFVPFIRCLSGCLLFMAAQAGPISITNAGFESGPAPALGAPGWTIISGGTDWFTTTAGAPDSVIDPPSAAEGTKWLSGNRLATGAASSSNPQLIEQLIDISANATLIDSGSANIRFDWMFSDDDPADSGQVKMSFFSDAGGTLPVGSPAGTGVIAPSAAWDSRFLVGSVPAGARSLRIELRIDRSSGTAGNIHFDDFVGEISDQPLADQADRVVGNLIMANENAGQCWYQDERIIYDPRARSLHMSTTADATGFGGATVNADVDHVSFDLTSRRRSVFAVGNMPLAYGADDHNMGAIWTRPDGRYLHVWAGHNGDHTSRYRISSQPGDPTTWGPEQSYNWETISGMSSSRLFTYSNLFFLSAERGGLGRLYNIGRGDQNSPNISYSDNWGDTWSYGGKLTTYNGTSPSSYSNGYFKYNSNGTDRIDFVSTEHHPRNWNNSIYHGYIQGGKSYNSFGVVIDNDITDETAPDPKDFTPVFVTSETFAGNHHHAWTTELERAPNGDIVALFTTRFGTAAATGLEGDADHRIFYARFNGTSWTHTELAKMGAGLYGSEQDYTGLGAIQPDDPSKIYISTPFHPTDDTPLLNHEIFKGSTADNGLTWTWTQITFDSAVDNLRPVIAKWDAQNTAVFWLRGSYNTSQNYDQALVGLIDSSYETMGDITYVDASGTNTTLANGSALTTTGPDAGDGLDDNLWHESTSFGNAGSALVCNATGMEAAPTLKTSVSGLPVGSYDVFAYFWSDTNQDWRIAASLDESSMPVFRRRSCQQAEASHFDAPVATLNGSRALYRAYVGRQTITDGETIEVFVSGVSQSSTAGTNRTAYDGIGVAAVDATLRVEAGGSYVMPDSTLYYSSVWNSGNLDVTQGTLLVGGDVTNDGTLRLTGDAILQSGGNLINNGVLDMINWSGTLPAGFINNGTILDSSVVKVSSIAISGDDITITIDGYDGHSYRLQHADSPAGPWSNLGSPMDGTGTGGSPVPLEFIHPDAMLEDNGFYRISVNPL